MLANALFVVSRVLPNIDFSRRPFRVAFLRLCRRRGHLHRRRDRVALTKELIYLESSSVGAATRGPPEVRYPGSLLEGPR